MPHFEVFQLCFFQIICKMAPTNLPHAMTVSGPRAEITNTLEYLYFVAVFLKTLCTVSHEKCLVKCIIFGS